MPTGTNLLGLVKHVTRVELGYFGGVFGHPSGDEPTWDESDPMADMFAAPTETREDITALYRRAWAHADIVRELIDGAAGLTPARPNIAASDEFEWQAHRDRVERAAQEAARTTGS